MHQSLVLKFQPHWNPTCSPDDGGHLLLLGGYEDKLRDAKIVPDTLADGVQQHGITAMKCTLVQKQPITNFFRDTAEKASHYFDGIHDMAQF
jgi:hypothetical protein